LKQLKNSLFHSFLFNYSSKILGITVSLILARIITPNEYGTFALALVFAGIGDLLKNFGVVDFLIKEKELTSNKIETAFGLIIITCILTASLLFAIAPLVGDFYGNETITELIQILTISVLFAPFGSITNAILRRNSEFKKLGIAQICTEIGGLLITLGLAWFGWGVYALALGFVAKSILLVICYHFFKVNETPAKPEFKGVSDILSYSSFATLSGIVSHFGNSSQYWIMGKALNMESIGFYSRAVSTVDLYNQVITQSLSPVMSSFFANSNRTEPDQLSRQYTKLVQVESSIAWPFFIFLGFHADAAVQILWGDQWGFIAEFLMYLCIAKAISIVTSHAPNVLLMLGKSKVLFKVNLLINIILVIAIFLSVEHGVKAVAVTICFVSSFCRILLFLACLKKYISLDFSKLFFSLIFSVMVSFISILVLLFWHYYSPLNSVIFEAFISSFTLLISWVFFNWIFNTYFYKEFLKKYYEVAFKKLFP